MRVRKPCTRARRRLFGWKVRLPFATVLHSFKFISPMNTTVKTHCSWFQLQRSVVLGFWKESELHRAAHEIWTVTVAMH